MNFDAAGRLWVASQRDLPADQARPEGQRQDHRPRRHQRRRQGRQDHRLRRRPAHPHRHRARRRRRLRRQQHRAGPPDATPKPGGKADKTRVVLSGFGTEDTHHIMHTLPLGPGRHACTSTSRSTSTATSRRRTASGGSTAAASGSSGPRRMELDVFVRGLVNTWGHHFDRYGQSFVTDGAGGEGINHGVPGGVLRHGRRAARQRILHGLNPGSPKYCGLEIVSGRHLPDDWQGDLHHQRLPRPPRLPVQAAATTAARFTSPRDARRHQDATTRRSARST